MKETIIWNTKNNKTEIAFKELDLNIKHQGIKSDEFMKIGYEYDKGVYVFMFIIPNPFRKEKLK